MSIAGMYDNSFDLSNEDFSDNGTCNGYPLRDPQHSQENKHHITKKKSREIKEKVDNSFQDNISSSEGNQFIGKKKGKWTKEEDEILSLIVRKYGGKNWRRVSEHIKGRTPIQCLHRWTKILMPGLVKGPWTIDEDRKLKEWVMKEGAERWSQCAETIQGRSGKQCRERWFNSLNPQVKKGNWSSEEDYRIFFLYNKSGGKWSKIAGYFEGRTENSIKNRFYSSLRRGFSEKKKSSTSQATSIGLDELIKFLPTAMEQAADKLKKSEGLSSEDLKRYEALLVESLSKSDKKPAFKINKLDIPNPISHETPDNKPQNVINTNPSTTNINLNVNFNSSNNSNYILCQFNPANGYSGNQNANNINIPPNNTAPKENNYHNMDLMTLEKEIYDMCDNSSMFFQDNQLLNIDNQLDSILDDLFVKNNITVTCDPKKECKICHEIPSQRKEMNIDMSGNGNNGVNNMNLYTPVTIPQEYETNMNMIDNMNVAKHNSDLSTWKVKCEEGKNKGEMLHSLLEQLNDLEKLVRSTKKELMKFEMPENEDYMDGLVMNNSTLGYNIDSIFKI